MRKRLRVGELNSPRVIQEEAVSDLLSHLDPDKSAGLDGIHPGVMRELVEELAKPLSIIYQRSWLIGEVQGDWRLVNVMPIHKKGREEDPGQADRSVMEEIILSGITQHLQDRRGDQTQPAWI
ncbi:hypothetical protein BTVI_00171 [Pitangus sulphuratus]|nr:hypothetical protein BTVI_00171 [Pitangus sulphuratus]